MIKNYQKSLVALVCAIGVTLGSCKKDSISQTDEFSPVESSEQSSTLATSSVAVSSEMSAPFILGVNGHPLGDDAYLGVSAADQIGLIKKMGMGIYRLNINTTSDGTCTVPKRLQPLLDAAAAGKVTLLPMLTPRTLSFNDSESAAYAAGKTIGGNFAAKYASVFKYYDMGNDLDLKTLLSGKDGRAIADYDQKKLLITAAYLKGMNDGIHANDPDAQTMISAGWVHWGFIKYCEDYGVKYDILAYHWYSDMEEAIVRAKSMKITDITVTLNGLFPGKPIWITEVNLRPGNLSTLSADQNTFLTTFIAKCKANPTVKALLVYELFDEPYKNGGERYYGIATWATPFTKWINRMAVDTFEKLFGNNSSNETTQPVTPPVTTPVAPPVTTPTTPVTTEFLTNIVGYTTKKPQLSKMNTGVTYYTDRTYQVKFLPSYLVNASLIKTANDDKVSTLNSFVSFKVSKAATVYIAYDPRASKLPSWLQSFTKVSDKLQINDPKLASMGVYKKEYAAGTVTLGGNMQGSATGGALCQYVLMVKEN